MLSDNPSSGPRIYVGVTTTHNSSTREIQHPLLVFLGTHTLVPCAHTEIRIRNEEEEENKGIEAMSSCGPVSPKGEQMQSTLVHSPGGSRRKSRTLTPSARLPPLLPPLSHTLCLLLIRFWSLLLFKIIFDVFWACASLCPILFLCCLFLLSRHRHPSVRDFALRISRAGAYVKVLLLF